MSGDPTDAHRELFDSVFEFLTKYRILRCLQCRCAVVPAYIQTHLADTHSTLTAAERRKIITYASNRVEFTWHPNSAILPAATDSPIQGFPLWHDGLRCQYDENGLAPCRYVCRSVQAMKKHAQKEHGWVSLQKRGGDKRLQSVYAANKI